MPIDSPVRILRLKTVLERTGLSRSTLYRMMNEGTFPRALRISARCSGWRECELEAWLENPETYRLMRSSPHPLNM